MANEYLKRTPTSSGNSRRWTVSFWMKNSDSTQGYTAIMGAGKVSPTNVYNEIFYNGSQTGLNLDKSSDPDNYNIIANPLLRDPSSWMHVVVSFTDQGDNANTRVKFYINGAFTDHNTGTNLDVSETSFFNHEDYIHYIGSRAQQSYGTTTFDAQYFDVFLVDGQALTPDVFGFYKDGDGYVSVGSTQSTDFRPGQWSPHSPRKIKSDIERRGGFGVNGFYLPMNDSSNVGADFHTTPNSIITLKGEDLPQPRNGAPTTSDAYVSELRTDPYAANLVLAVPGISTATGANLVTNGTFDTNTTGWTSQDATLSVDNGRIKVLTTNTNYGSALQTVTGLTVGQRYTFQVDMYYGNASLVTAISGATPSINSGWQSADYVWRTSFTATTTSLVIDFQMASQSNVYGFWDNVILKAEDAPRDYSADIKGSGTNKTLTANGNAGVGYEIPGYYGSAMNFNGSGDDAIFVPASSDIDLTGDFTLEYWTYVDSNVTYSAQLSSKNYYNGSNLQDGNFYLGQIHNGTLGLYSYNGQSSGVTISYTIPSAARFEQWQHICFERNGNTMSTYLNGVAVAVDTNWTRSLDDASNGLYIGKLSKNGGTDDYGNLDGKIQDLRIYSGVAKYKGGFDVPKPYTPVGIESWRQVSDTCKNNFCTMNPLNHSGGTFANGNLTTSEPGSSGAQIYATMGSNTGKWYYEAHVEDVGTPNTGGTLIGINPLIRPSSNIQNRTAYRSSGDIYNDSSGNSGSSAYAYVAGDTIGVAWDADNKRLWFAKNGTWLGSGDPAGNSNSNVNYTNTETQGPFIAYDNGTGAQVTHLNFGQNPTFSGTVTAGTYADGNGKGLFKYAPPTGFLALCEDNLPTPAIADPGEHFKTVLYTGALTSGAGQLVSGVGFQPDLIWIKNRARTGTNGDGYSDHALFDSVRGYDSWLRSNTTGTENTNTPTNRLTGAHKDGFSVGYYYVTGYNGDNYVAWCWKAGGAAVTNTDGALTSQVSVNQDAGFSIATYTTPGTATNFGHGLGKKPAFALFKARNDTGNWAVYHQSLGTNTIRLSTDGAKDTSADAFNNTAPTDTLMYLGTWAGTNNPNINWVSYLWTEVEGFSKFGSYVGNGNADGPFVYCGFKPAWVMVKNIDDTGGRDWGIQDSSRKSTNPCNKHLKANQSEVENSGLADSTYQIDMLSNGFKVRNNTGIWNNNGETIIFAAFAESPFQTANAK